MTLYGHFGNNGDNSSFIPAGFFEFSDHSIRAGNSKRSVAEEETIFPRGSSTGRICFVQIVTLGWPVGATVALTKQQRRLAGRVFAMFFCSKRFISSQFPRLVDLKLVDMKI